MFHVKHDTAPPPPATAEQVFGDRLGLAQRYAAIRGSLSLCARLQIIHIL